MDADKKNPINKEEKKQQIKETYFTKKEVIFIQMVNIIMYTIINYFFYLNIKLPSNKFFYISVTLTYIIPTLIVIYTIIFENYYQPPKTQEELENELKKENLKEKTSNVGTIVFGLALFLIALKRKHIGSVVPYLICAVVFGLSIPEILDYTIIDHDNLKRVININDLQTGSVILSGGFLFMGFYLTIYYFTKHSEIKFYSLHSYNKK